MMEPIDYSSSSSSSRQQKRPKLQDDRSTTSEMHSINSGRENSFTSQAMPTWQNQTSSSKTEFSAPGRAKPAGSTKSTTLSPTYHQPDNSRAPSLMGYSAIRKDWREHDEDCITRPSGAIPYNIFLTSISLRWQIEKG